MTFTVPFIFWPPIPCQRLEAVRLAYGFTHEHVLHEHSSVFGCAPYTVSDFDSASSGLGSLKQQQRTLPR